MKTVKVKLYNGVEIECYEQEAVNLEKAGKLFKEEKQTKELKVVEQTKELKEVEQTKEVKPVTQPQSQAGQRPRIKHK
jgi:hypothetical protein